MYIDEITGTELQRDQALRDRRKREHQAGLVSHYRLLCDDVVIDSWPVFRSETDPTRLLQHFKDNLFNAQMDPDFLFVGAGPKMNGKEYIKFHEERLGVELSTNFQIINPGDEWFPLAPGLKP